MNDAVDAVERGQPVGVLAHIAAHLFHACGQISGPAFGVDPLLQGVEDADAIARGDEAIYGVRADKAGTTCD